MNGTAAAGAIGQDAGYTWLRHYPEHVDWHTTFEAQPLDRIMSDAVARYGTRTCTNFLGRTLTYAEIGALVDKAAAGLQRLGVKKGTKVGLFLPNSPTFIIYYYAILRAGGVVVNYNPLYTLPELAFQVKDSDTEIMVTLDLKLLFDKVEGLLADGVLARAIVASFPGLLPASKSVLFRLFKARDLARPMASPVADRIVLEAKLLDGDGRPSPVTVDPEADVAILQYTGGTTGTPKGAMLTHANAYVNVHQALAWVSGLEPGKERMLGVLPFFHVFAMTGVMNFGLAIGAEMIIMPRFVLDDALKLIDKTKPTIMPGVPTLFNAIMNHPKIKSFDLSSLKFCLSGGAPLPLEVKRGFEAITGCKVVEAYGLTETSPAVTINPLEDRLDTEGKPREGWIGQPIPGTIIELRSLDDPMRPAAPGERGEICIAGPQVMKGYYKRPEETAKQFVGHFVRTGDVGVMDEQGFFKIVDRIKDLIICSGYNVYPRVIEEAIYKHPAVEEVTVIGIPDQYRGEAPKAFVKLKAGQSTTADAIMAHLETLISRIEMPASIEFRDQLPKTMIGKLSKKELKAEEARAQAPS